MRQVDAALAAAIEAPERTTRIRLSVDWDGDGHGGPGSLDDLSGKVASLNVGAVLQTTLPEQVAVVEGTAAATLSADLAGGDSSDERLDAIRYFSPRQPDSPLYGKQRLGRSVELDLEVLTATGWQRVPMLRGVSRGLPASVAARTAQFAAVDNRGNLRTKVQLPVVVADAPPYVGALASPVKPGLEGGWIVSYVLWRCGYPLSPTPRDGCRLWIPMHGSMVPFIGRQFGGAPPAWMDTTDSDLVQVKFTEGPFFLAADIPVGQRVGHVQGPAGSGPRIFAPDGRSACRIEFWLKADGGLALAASALLGSLNNDASALFSIFAGGLMRLELFNGSAETVDGPTLTMDGGWHLVGVHWDDAAGRAVFRIDATSTAVSFAPTAAAGLGVTVLDTVNVSFDAFAPVAELHVTAGLAEGDDWLPLVHESGAVVDRSQLRLDGIAPSESAEGWSILQELAEAEQGAVFIDADGRPHYATRARLVSPQAQVSQRTLTARADLLELGYDLSLDQIKNVVTCPYQPVTVTMRGEVWSLSETVTIPPLRSHTVAISASLATSFDDYLGQANTVSDGSGTGYFITPGDPEVTLTLTRAGPTTVELRIANNTGTTVWLVSPEGRPDLVVRGDVVQQGAGADTPTYRNAASIAKYAEQPLTLNGSRWVQRRGHALGLAMATGLDLGEPEPILSDLSIPSDPRLEYFDRFTVVDENTGISGDFWYLGGSTRLDARGGAVQTVTARPARDRFIAGTGIVGRDLLG